MSDRKANSAAQYPDAQTACRALSCASLPFTRFALLKHSLGQIRWKSQGGHKRNPPCIRHCFPLGLATSIHRRDRRLTRKTS